MKRTLMASAIVALALVTGARAWATEEDVEDAYYRIEEVPIPKDIVLEVGGLGFTPNGKLAIATRRGDIWIYDPHKSGPPETLPAAAAAKGIRAAVPAAWSLFAQGLHEPLGLLVNGNGDFVVAQRPELTRVRDTNGDGRADQYETLTASWGVSGNYHEYSFGPVRDKDGNLYGTLNVGWLGHGVSLVPYRGWAYKLTPQGQFIPFASGFRSPAGIGISPKGELYVTDNQGDWVATSPVFHVEQDHFYGHPSSLRWEPGYKGPEDAWELPAEDLAKRRTLPAAWFIYGAAGHSPTQPVWDTTNGRFGPFAGQMLVGDQTKSIVSRVALETVDGQEQGAVIRFRRGFGSGITRMAFGPDHALWVGGTDRGWGATGGRSYALERVTYTGAVPFEIQTMSIAKDGFDLTFTKPVDATMASDPTAYSLSHYTFRYWHTYGSPHVETTSVRVSEARVSPDGRGVHLKLPAFVTPRVYQLDVRPGWKSADGTALLHGTAYYNVNRVRP